MLNFFNHIGANPGRSGHRLAVESARMVYDCRLAIARLFNAPDPLRVAFTANVTEAINLVLHGLLRPGDHVITTSMEHNSVMRPLRQLENQGVKLTVIPCSPAGVLDLQRLEKAIRPETVLVVLNHASNVCGTILPAKEAGNLCRQYGPLLLVDAAQTAGIVPIDLPVDQIDLLAFTGHKSLYGPMGTGGLVIGPRVDPARLHPLKQGGTGSRSEFEEQPGFLPDRYESGTLNAIGLAGLAAGIQWLETRSLSALRAHEQALCERLIVGLNAIPGITVYGLQDASLQTATVAFNVAGMMPSEVGQRLDEEWGILCRVGLHCAPAAHRTLGTFPGGCVRFGLGAFNTIEEVEYALKATGSLK